MHHTLLNPGVESAANALPDDCGLAWRPSKKWCLTPFVFVFVFVLNAIGIAGGNNITCNYGANQMDGGVGDEWRLAA